jgi:hypothetical protein
MNIPFTPTQVGSGVNGGMAVIPDPLRLLSISQPNPGSTATVNPGLFATGNGILPANDHLCFSTPLNFNGVLVHSTPATGGVGGAYFDLSRLETPVIEYFPGTFVAPASDLSAVFVNESGSSFTIQPTLGHVDANGNAHLDYTGLPVVAGVSTPAVLAWDHTAGGFIVWQAAISSGANLGFWIGFQVAGGDSQLIQEGSFGEANLPNLVLEDNTPTWTTYSLFDLLSNSSSVQTQFASASQACVTGISFLLQNTTPMLTKGGDLYAARLPGYSRKMPGSIQQIIKVVQSQTHHKLQTNELAKGLHWSYLPEKVQDWLFSPVTNYGNPSFNSALPFLAVAYNQGNVVDTVPTFNLKICVMIEYITTDPSNFFLMSPSTPGYFEMLVNALSKENGLSENPDHVEKIKKIVKDVVNSDEFKMFASQALQAGVRVGKAALPYILEAFQ